MTVWIRIALYMIAGWLYGSGYIGEEVRSLITEDPAVSASIEAGTAALIAAVPLSWWRAAKRLGHPT
jgi:hypothetical protein